MTRATTAPRSAKIAVLQTILPDYRRPVFEALRALVRGDVTIIAGEGGFEQSLRSLVGETSCCRVVGNRFLCGRRLLWQAGVLRPLLAADVAVVELNPRILSTWLLLCGRALLRRPTIVWGHATSRKGPRSATNVLRRGMLRLASAALAYTESDARVFERAVAPDRVFAAPNALYSRARQSVPVSGDPGCTFLVVGRLTAEKRPALALRGFAAAKPRLPGAAELVVVGDGPLRMQLETEASALDIGESVRFVGHVSDFAGLHAQYDAALASVSPGCVGLSLTQSLWFGVPMLIAGDEPHGPEIEAARDGWNSSFFRAGDAESLASVMVQVAAERAEWIARRAVIAGDCRSRYALENMTAGFAKAIGHCLPGAAS